MPSAKIRSAADLQIRSVNREARTIDFIASTFALDSHGTRIDQSGWTFARNIPITWAHDDRGYTPSGGRPIGRAINLRVENGQLRGTAEFPKRGIFQFADETFDLAADGFIPSTSVGFDPIEEEVIEENGQRVPIYRKQKLIEIAFVTIPSNEEADILARAKALNRVDSLAAITERLKRIEQLAEESKTEPEPEEISEESKPEDVQKWRGYFEQKQPINKKSSAVLKKFYMRVLDSEPPADEGAAWDRMGEAIDAIEETKDDPKPAEETPAEEAVAEEKPLEVAPDKPSDPTPPAEAPPAAQKASVHIPFDLLANMPASMTRSFVEVGVEALRRGITVKDAMQLIDGMNDAVSTSFTSIQHGSNH